MRKKNQKIRDLVRRR